MYNKEVFTRVSILRNDGGYGMKFVGIRRVFSTENEEQYVTIGAFWDELSDIYGRENLMGLGYNLNINSRTNHVRYS